MRSKDLAASALKEMESKNIVFPKGKRYRLTTKNDFNNTEKNLRAGRKWIFNGMEDFQVFLIRKLELNRNSGIQTPEKPRKINVFGQLEGADGFYSTKILVGKKTQVSLKNLNVFK